MSETVTITKAEHDRLTKSDLFLQCLEACGVDNWEWYDEACALYKVDLEKLGLETDDDQ